jgi:hypothetical protein
MERTGGLEAWAGQIPRWLRILLMASGCSMGKENDGGRSRHTQIESGPMGSLAA